MNRPNRHEWLMSVAQLSATRSTCSRAHVGCVIAKEGRILSTGYNGAPPGMPHCNHNHVTIGGATPNEITLDYSILDGPCKVAVHAELNAIAWAARMGVATLDATIYTTHQPCIPCGQAIVSAGIAKVWYLRDNRYHTPFVFPDPIEVYSL